MARLRACRVVPVATIEDPGSAPTLAAALRAGGIGCLEVAFRHPRAAEALRAARGVEGLLVGAGMIRSLALRPSRPGPPGPKFAVAPGTNAAVLEACRALGLPFFPGVATPTEIERALGLGLETLKVFPAAQSAAPPSCAPWPRSIPASVSSPPGASTRPGTWPTTSPSPRSWPAPGAGWCRARCSGSAGSGRSPRWPRPARRRAGHVDRAGESTGRG